MLGQMRVVDLTQPLDEGTVMWPGAPAPTAETILTVEHDGFYNRRLTLMEHTGTHFDAPCHMVRGRRDRRRDRPREARATRRDRSTPARRWQATPTRR